MPGKVAAPSLERGPGGGVHRVSGTGGRGGAGVAEGEEAGVFQGLLSWMGLGGSSNTTITTTTTDSAPPPAGAEAVPSAVPSNQTKQLSEKQRAALAKMKSRSIGR